MIHIHDKFKAYVKHGYFDLALHFKMIPFFPLNDALIGCSLLLRSKIAADHTLKTHLWYS